MQRLGAALVCLLFALPFGGVGVGASWVLYRMVQDSRRAQEWVGVSATVDKFGHGAVEYHYTFRGREYRGDRLGANPIGGTDNVDSWHDDMFEMFSAAKAQGKPITVWVNPDDPSQSMVDRSVRWKLFAFGLPFALGFGGVGVGALFMFFRTLSRSSAGIAEQPDPVMSLNPSPGRGVLSTWIFAFFWNVISIPIAIIAVPGAIAEGQWAALLVLIFPLIGALLLWGAISVTINAVRDRFRRQPELPTLLAPKAPAHDGVFARGLIDDTRPAAAGEGTIDPGDDGLPRAVDPAIAQLEKLSGRQLTAQQREQLEKMDPKARAVMAKIAGWAGKIKQAQD